MTLILEVATPGPFRKSFDYLAPAKLPNTPLEPGIRVTVPFKNRQITGILLKAKQHSDYPIEKLKTVTQLLDSKAILPKSLLQLCFFASKYYHHPLGEVLTGALPKNLRIGKAEPCLQETRWQVTPAGTLALQDLKWQKKAKKQAKLLHEIALHGNVSETVLQKQQNYTKRRLQALFERGYVQTSKQLPTPFKNENFHTPYPLTTEQQYAVDTVKAHFNHFSAYLLQGITGSGKTEVYCQLIAIALQKGKQSLVLVPEISLTPQLIDRFQKRFTVPIAVLHSGVTDKQRLKTWTAAKLGHIAILIGTRSAIFTPLPKLGLIIVDEEHDLSFKQQTGFRYSARDLAVYQAKQYKIPLLLGSATPSLETLYNQQTGKYGLLTLTQRTGVATSPQLRIVDLNQHKTSDGLAFECLGEIRQHLNNNKQVLIFLNRRGYAPALFCNQCHYISLCPRCERPYTYHLLTNRLCCHHCDTEKKVPTACEKCSSTELVPLGAGTERVETLLHKKFPSVEVLRIDRDSTRKKGTMESLLATMEEPGAKILVGTQMLAKGHHFPEVTLVIIIGADGGLFSSDFFALERFGQQILQVSGRAGRAKDPGKVLIQTRYPNHPQLKTLLQQNYRLFAEELLHERQQAALPPFSFFVLWRAEANSLALVLKYLAKLKQHVVTAEQWSAISALGPIPAIMQKRQGRYRAQLLLQAKQRSLLSVCVDELLDYNDSLALGHKVRWSVDIDPKEMF